MHRLAPKIQTFLLCAALVAPALVTVSNQVAQAQGASKAKKKKRSKRRRKRTQKKKSNPAAAAPARGREESEGGRSVKVYEFSGLDISGRLLSPQMLYFFNRVRTEFDRPRLPHRSFIPELERSSKESVF